LNGIQEVRGSIPLASMAWQESTRDASSTLCSEECRDTRHVVVLRCAIAPRPGVSASETHDRLRE
jgi:hypothetical protein